MRYRAIASALFASLILTAPAWGNDGDSLPRGTVGHVLNAEEDLQAVSRLYGVSVQSLQQANPTLVWGEGVTVVVPVARYSWPTHTVRAGETLWRIGKAYDISVEQLRQANEMSDNTLFPGRVLLLPRAEKPEWSLAVTEPAVPPSLPSLPPSTDPAETVPEPVTRDTPPSTRLTGQWVEVRLPDNRRAWAPVAELVIGSWQPQSPARVIEVGREFVGVPYKWGGVDPNGWDCSGFIQEVFRLAGHQVPRLADAQYEAFTRVEAEGLEPGDLVFFNTDGSGISHVGIYTGDRRFLHASSSRGVVEDSLEDSYFSRRYVGAGRLPVWAELQSAQLIDGKPTEI